MAEREGFEPSRRWLTAYAISSRVPSARLGHLSASSIPWTCFSINGGERGIRTLGTVLPVQPLSRRLPSARLGHLSAKVMAEGVGFEPTEACASAVFKTAALSQTRPSLRSKTDFYISQIIFITKISPVGNTLCRVALRCWRNAGPP